MQNNHPEESPGVFSSVRRLCDLTVAAAYNRVELFSVELQEEKERLVRVLTLGAALVIVVNMAVIMVTLTVVYLAGEAARGPVLIGLTLLYLLAAVVGYFNLRKELRAAGRPFEDTLGEIKKDSECLTAQS